MDDQRNDDRTRFIDPAIQVPHLAAEDIMVVCPRCANRAISRAYPNESRFIISWPRRLTCPTCAYTADWDASSCSAWGGPTDPFFRFPLWLTAECCGGRELWVLNAQHLDLLEQYVAARIRERLHGSGMTMIARLPAWIKSAKHRAEILRTIHRLRATLDEPPVPPRDRVAGRRKLTAASR
ncbi:TFIIB-type zinc ribbon-containing protein [Actinoalloteichus hymeniacidonis]|uniref:Uncharacterized protein n=1 Tax=Actinoalloteichus hymeniacidonis TaxID=340345 RepID=A0AAC9MZD1_9PSEU|nr:TFIIB-type zinc ribbon-containing protein [Actinoalloteichus hymeniacidonis]AOS63841.1 hypothetical protein TL08_15160 [Actinoalloteichus hymeniacidonis]MBB5908103.1 hypothetical protein [Actinoalloteichus hymeniacidonis]